MIIAVTDRKISCDPDLSEQVRRIAAASPDMIILREKDLPEPEYKVLARKCFSICNEHKVRFCVNSFIDTARDIGTDSIQLPFNIFKEQYGGLDDFKDVIASVHSVDEAVEAEGLGATHLICGNVFETSCKPGAAGKGIEELRRICNSVNIPVFAIGGINADNIRSVMDTGCDGVCVRGLFMNTDDPSGVMNDLRSRSSAGDI